MVQMAKKMVIGILALVMLLSQSSVAFAQGVLIINTNIEYDGTGLLLDAGDLGGDITLQFGKTLNKYLKWHEANQYFAFNDNVSLEGNELINFRLENLASPPACDNSVIGRMYQNTVDDKTYVCDGNDWQDITAVSSTSTKVITVGSSGADYSSIAGAAGYLNGLTGGIILLYAETHVVDTAVNLQNITLIGKDSSNTKIMISGDGKINSFDTSFVKTAIETGAINNTMGIDVLPGSSSVYFEWVSFIVNDSGDVMIDSTAGTSPTVNMKFVKSTGTGSGTMLNSKATANINISSTIFVDSRGGDQPLNFQDWDVILSGSGNVYTEGIITSVPSNSIFVSPLMSLQGAINSIESTGNGGMITLLPGTHNISDTLTINGDGIKISGYGDSSIILASGFSVINDETAAVQVGASDGSSPVHDVVLKDFKLNVSDNIHGIRVAGGNDNRISDVTVQKFSGQSGSGPTANVAIQMLDSSVDKLLRPVVENCRVLGNGGTNYFTDGIHVTSDSTISGVWGYGRGIKNALIEGNNVDYVRESSYVIIGSDDSSLYNNRASHMGAISGGVAAYGIFIGNSSNINMNANVFSGSLSEGAIAIGVESFNTGVLKETNDCVFNNNIIDGIGGNGGLGFVTGFQVGATSNTGVLRNSFQNNKILGASNPSGGTTRGVYLRGNVDGNTISSNSISGGTNPWDIGIELQSSAQENNIIADNRMSNVTNKLIDNGTRTNLGVLHYRSDSNPTVNDDINIGYEVGSIWINTTSDMSYILVDGTVGAAVWNRIDGPAGGGAPIMANYYDSMGGVDVNVASWVPIPWDRENREDAGFTHSTTVNNSRVYMDEAAWYKVFYSVSHSNQANSRKNIACAVRLNGSSIIAASASTAYSRNITDRWGTNNGTALVQTTSPGEYYEIVCYGIGSDVGITSALTGVNISWTIAEKK